MPLKKPSVVSAGSSSMPTPASLGSWGKAYPTLCEFLSALTWEDGSSRECGSVILFWDREAGAWKACLNCKDTSRVGFVSGDSPDDLLKGLERALANDRIDWRPARGAGGRKRS